MGSSRRGEAEALTTIALLSPRCVRVDDLLAWLYGLVMAGFSFRIRFHRSASDTINISAPRWEWNIGGDSSPLVLCSQKQEEAIQDSKTWVFKSEGWSSEGKATQAATKYIDALMLTLARLRIGADFGSRAPKSGYMKAGLAMLESESGCRVLNDIHGLITYESEPPPRFATLSGNFVRGVPPEQFELVFSKALESSRELSDRERLSLELYNASFFQDLIDARFLLLVMAIEALLEPSSRSQEALEHVESIIAATQDSVSLSHAEKESLVGSLKWLRSESISNTGRTFASKQLGERTYMNKRAVAFFSYCYELRSRLVHGYHHSPSGQEIGSVFQPLQMFVSDILSKELRDIVP